MYTCMYIYICTKAWWWLSCMLMHGSILSTAWAENTPIWPSSKRLHVDIYIYITTLGNWATPPLHIYIYKYTHVMLMSFVAHPPRPTTFKLDPAGTSSTVVCSAKSSDRIVCAAMLLLYKDVGLHGNWVASFSVAKGIESNTTWGPPMDDGWQPCRKEHTNSILHKMDVYSFKPVYSSVC